MKALTKHFMFPDSFILQWHITERCNWSCKHCYREKKTIKELPLSKLFNIFFQYIELVKALKISKGRGNLNITGGEPFIRSDFFQLLEFIHKHNKIGLNIGILSNGSLITRENTVKLKSLGVSKVQLSIEGMREINNDIRGEGTFDMIIEKTKILLDAGILSSISVTLTRENMPDMSALVQLCDDLGVPRLGIRRFVPLGIGKHNRLSILTPKEMREIYQWKRRMRNRLRTKGSKLHLVYGCEDGIFTNDLALRRSCGVIDGRCLTLFPNGDVLACRRLPIKIGNALQKSLLEIYFSSDKLWQMRDQNNAHNLCKKCKDFHFCHGGALCISHAYFNRFSVPDPSCWRIFKDLPSRKLFY